MSQIETDLIHSGEAFNETRSVVPPIYQTATYFADSNPDDFLKAGTEARYPYFYQRHGNPVSSQTAELIAKLEGKEAALLTATGMAAISTAVLSVVRAGDHVVAQLSHYSAASILLKELLPQFGIDVSYFDQQDITSLDAVLRDNTRLIYLETPSNPNLAITDLAYVANLAKARGIVTICDNTFASPINQRPGDHGIDVVVHSATKYLGGHSDLTAGVICGTEEMVNQAWKKLLSLGGSLAPFDAWLLLRGLRTLSLRVKQINENALALAQWFEKHPLIKRVLYCGLPSHPQYALAKRQMNGYTGMLCVEVVGKDEQEQFERAQLVLNNLRIFANAASLGGVESLAVHPASMWGLHHSPEQKLKAGINDGMLRISVGIEHIDDLVGDFEQALG
ncbi:trans-sulfuration enzyme family protein [Parapedobacter indicus]|uniref:Methionine-gamma-lyase n=1 Tax=Parapedobacter indicus TaxID=1477437 RepID=A0A1I3M0M0_9SPHI|nr:aminotransferase class I/II-fold pyridoxal phosphate-dependent enzyme [Parapedobacter indicus]PPL01320.1 methionine-gamma-lyase [Parapedobacter indicus]SFI90513.1 methionine-gamma-lyase [Parapedobacter indicus]